MSHPFLAYSPFPFFLFCISCDLMLQKHIQKWNRVPVCQCHFCIFASCRTGHNLNIQIFILILHCARPHLYCTFKCLFRKYGQCCLFIRVLLPMHPVITKAKYTQIINTLIPLLFLIYRLLLGIFIYGISLPLIFHISIPNSLIIFR